MQAESNDQLKNDYSNLKKKYDGLQVAYLECQQKLGAAQQEIVELDSKYREQQVMVDRQYQDLDHYQKDIIQLKLKLREKSEGFENISSGQANCL